MIKEPTQNTSKSKEVNELKQAVDAFKALFDDLHSDAATSSELLDLNIEDSFAAFVKESLKNPLEMAIQSFLSMEKSVEGFISIALHTFFRQHISFIKSIYKEKRTDNVLYYNILLVDDSIETKKFLLNFSSKYQHTPLASRFPLLLETIPNSIEKEFNEEMSKNKHFEKVL